jgi:hypothetical protein
MSDFAQIRFLPNRPLLRELSADRLNTILQEIKRNKPKGERGITVRQDGTGTYIGLAASLPRGGASTPTTRQPWDLIARVDPDADPEDENPSYLVSVQPGTLNNILPSNWNTVGIDGAVDVPCAGTGLHYAKAVIATDGEAITGVTIAIDTTEPMVQEPQEFGIAAEVEYLFGLFAEGGVYRVIGAGHIVLDPSLWIITNAASPSPGDLPYTLHYYLR